LSVPVSTLQKIVISSGLVDIKRFKQIQTDAKNKGVSVENLLLEQGLIDSSKLLEIQGGLLGVQTIDLRHIKIPREILNLVPEPIARRHNVLAFAKEGQVLSLAMTDPDNLQIREFIKKTSGLEVKPFLTTPEGLEAGLSLYHNNIEEEFNKILGTEKFFSTDGSAASLAGLNDQLASMAEQIPVIRVVDTLIEYAIFEKASDIHLEAQDDKVVVRYRIDGILHDVMSLPKVMLGAIVARIKVLSNLKIDEHRLPQDGRFKKETSGSKVAFRVSTIPVFDGEKVVMRLLDETARPMTLEELGFSKKSLEIIARNIRKPHGAILVTGPTGSGKSTTLYSILSLLNTRSVNISTIEDPIEYRMSGVNQMQVNPKINLTFAMGLRALLRQDPNIIMIGEIRDKETAEEAVHAAMTGHLVLSTLHTNSAAGAPPRLLDMGVEPFLIASTVNVLAAQRLVRQLCKNCMVSYNLTGEQIEELSKHFSMTDLLRIMQREGAIASKVNSLEGLLFFKGQGCDRCSNTGYKGRQGIYEVMEVTDAISELIMKRWPANAIEAKAVEQGMVQLWQDGFIKAHMGVTSIEEVLRVSKE